MSDSAMQPSAGTPGIWQGRTRGKTTQGTSSSTTAPNQPHKTSRKRLMTDAGDEASPPPPKHGAPIDPSIHMYTPEEKTQQQGLVKYFPEATTSSPSTDKTTEAGLSAELNRNYSDIAADILKSTTAQLAEVQTDLHADLADLFAADSAFLSMIQQHHAAFGRPLSESLASSIVIAGLQGPDGGRHPRTDTARVGELVAGCRARVDALEGELSGLWEEWEAAWAEVELAIREWEAYGEKGGGVKGMLKKLRAEGNPELAVAAEEAYQKMKANEEKYKRLILLEHDKLPQAVIAQRSEHD